MSNFSCSRLTYARPAGQTTSSVFGPLKNATAFNGPGSRRIPTFARPQRQTFGDSAVVPYKMCGLWRGTTSAADKSLQRTFAPPLLLHTEHRTVP